MGGNSFISEALGSAGATDTGWITVTIDLPDLAAMDDGAVIRITDTDKAPEPFQGAPYSQAIRAGDAKVMVAGGMESMSNAPHYLFGLREGVKFGNQQLIDGLIHDGLWCAFDVEHMGTGTQRYANEREAFGLRGMLPDRVQTIEEQVQLELERVANHVGDLGALAGDVSFQPAAAFFGRLRGECLNMLMTISGNRYGRRELAGRHCGRTTRHVRGLWR